MQDSPIMTACSVSIVCNLSLLDFMWNASCSVRLSFPWKYIEFTYITTYLSYLVYHLGNNLNWKCRLWTELTKHNDTPTACYNPQQICLFGNEIQYFNSVPLKGKLNDCMTIVLANALYMMASVSWLTDSLCSPCSRLYHNLMCWANCICQSMSKKPCIYHWQVLTKAYNDTTGQYLTTMPSLLEANPTQSLTVTSIATASAQEGSVQRAHLFKPVHIYSAEENGSGTLMGVW